MSYRTQRGETFSKLFRFEGAARRFARKVLDHGGDARLHRARITGWIEERPCGACEYGVALHGHGPR